MNSTYISFDFHYFLFIFVEYYYKENVFHIIVLSNLKKSSKICPKVIQFTTFQYKNQEKSSNSYFNNNTEIRDYQVELFYLASRYWT